MHPSFNTGCCCSVFPGFCSQQLSVSAFYLLLLIVLTYTCVELHGHNFRPIVWLWKPFHIQKHPLLMSLLHFFFCLTLSFCLFLLKGTEVHNADGELVSGTPHVLWVDAAMHYSSDKHLPFAITAYLTLFFISLPPIHLILYPCKAFKRCPNCCHNKRWHAMHTFVEAFYGYYKDGVTGGWDFQSMSGIYTLFHL